MRQTVLLTSLFFLSGAAQAQNIVANPTGSQSIQEPSTTPASQLFVNRMEGIRYADRFCSTPGVLDDTCIQGAIDDAADAHIVFIPPGDYAIKHTIYIYRPVTIIGAGQQVTALVAKGDISATDIIQVNAAAQGIGGFTIRDLTISTDVARTAGVALHFINSGELNCNGHTTLCPGPFRVVVENVDIRADGSARQWIGLEINTGNYYTIRNVFMKLVSRAGIRLRGASASLAVGDVRLENIQVVSGARSWGSLVIGTHAAGIYASNLVFEGGDVPHGDPAMTGDGHVVLEDDGGGGLFEEPHDLFFDQLVCDNPATRGMSITAAHSAYFTNSWFVSAGQHVSPCSGEEGVRISGSSSIDIRFNTSRFISNCKSGIDIQGGKNIWITDSLIDGNGSGTFAGIHVAANVTDFHIQSNAFFRDGTTKSQTYSVKIENGTSDRYTIINNDLYGFTLAPTSIGTGHGTNKITSPNLQ